MKKIGIDGCKAGWLMVAIESNAFHFALLSQIEEIEHHVEGNQTVLIDMPIGLADDGINRNIDDKIRTELKGRASTVFSPPCRRAVYAEHYEQAQEINRHELGKGISIQAWNICPKIKELDLYLSKNPQAHLIESHPELCFKQLNNGAVLQTKKQEKAGITQRLQILALHEPSVQDWYQEVKSNTLRKHIKADDILDALSLAISQYHQLDYLFGDETFDTNGIEMKIAYPRLVKI